MNRKFTATLLSIAVVSITTIILCFRTPYSASDMEIVPDSVEYCSGAYNLLTQGLYQIQIGNEWHPPRYPPWFSLFFVLPAYIAAPLNMGAPIIVILLMAVFATSMAYLLGKSFSSHAGGLLAAAFLLFLPEFRQSAMSIMTDVPCTAFCLASAAIYMKLSRQSHSGIFLLAGLSCAAAVSLRPLTVFMCLPFLIHLAAHRPASFLKKTILLTAPIAAIIISTAFYNHMTFGSVFRSGYNYWCAVPCDYFNLTFNIRFVSINLATFVLAAMYVLPVFLILLFFCLKTSRVQPAIQEQVSRLLFFTLLATTPLTAAHILYFFTEARFFLPPLALIAACTGGLLGSRIKSAGPSLTILIALLMISSASLVRLQSVEHVPARRIITETIRNTVPDNATVISAIDPVYLSLMLKDRKLYILPLSRTVEYASKVMSPTRTRNPIPRPTGSYDHRAEGILHQGVEPVPVTAEEMMDLIVLHVRQGRMYVLETAYITSLEYPALEKFFSIFPTRKISDNLHVLGLPNTQASSPADSTEAEAF